MTKSAIPSSSKWRRNSGHLRGAHGELKKKYGEVKSALETDPIGSSHYTRSLASAPTWWSWGTTPVRVVMTAAAPTQGKLDPQLRGRMIALLKEYQLLRMGHEMPGLDRSIIEHRLPLKKGFQQRARQMKAEILEEVKKEIEKMLAAGYQTMQCANGYPYRSVEKKDGGGEWLSISATLTSYAKDEYPMHGGDADRSWS
ncbi:hypothetical protein QYE76_007334 [Lolium multiflorum]|uniref:Uncharacterized protein n=1 Tax=Lolium multiflorum TaxID=4521 RepID=A0AAD8W472_LOLMU|nr:hypothetical protein QYE76_007334 [Lolium multiflorum]